MVVKMGGGGGSKGTTRVWRVTLATVFGSRIPVFALSHGKHLVISAQGSGWVTEAKQTSAGDSTVVPTARAQATIPSQMLGRIRRATKLAIPDAVLCCVIPRESKNEARAA